MWWHICKNNIFICNIVSKNNNDYLNMDIVSKNDNDYLNMRKRELYTFKQSFSLTLPPLVIYNY